MIKALILAAAMVLMPTVAFAQNSDVTDLHIRIYCNEPQGRYLDLGVSFVEDKLDIHESVMATIEQCGTDMEEFRSQLEWAIMQRNSRLRLNNQGQVTPGFYRFEVSGRTI